jgi:type II secretory pathway pseudopilin PulG
MTMALSISKNRGGMSLLEVLVSMGILVAALSGVAALLPAAGSRMAEASAVDRASALAANAYADMCNRRLISTSLFNNVPAGTAIVLGEALTNAVITGATTVDGANDAALRARIDPDSPTSFHLEDDLVFQQTLGTLPTNSFESATLRQFKRGACYGAMLSPTAFGIPPAAGSVCRLSVVVLRKSSSTPAPLTLTRIASDSTVFKIPLPNSDVLANPIALRLANEATQRRYLRPCSWLLVLPAAPNPSPRWFQIASAWTTTAFNPASNQTEPAESFVSFASQEVATIPPASGNLDAISLEGVLVVDERLVTLE